MFSRSSRRNRRVVSKPAKVEVIKPEQKPALDLSTAKIEIIKPEHRFKVEVEEEDNSKEEDE